MADQPITVYPARNVVTMNPSLPLADAVAVRGERIVCVGSVEECASWGSHTIDDRFADLVLVPGFVEVHAHAMEGLLGQVPFVSRYDRMLPNGTVTRGVRDYAEMVARLRALDATLDDPDAPLTVLGFDPIHFPDEPRLDRHVLDRVSATRPVLVVHTSLHVATANTALLQLHRITAARPTPGIGVGGDGAANGELREFPAMTLAGDSFSSAFALLGEPATLENLGRIARNVGTTTVADLGTKLLGNPDLEAARRTLVDSDAFPARLCAYEMISGSSAADATDAAAQIVARRSRQSAKLRFPGVKVVLDGSIQGWTAMLGEPGYYRGDDHGQLLVVPEQLVDLLRPFHRAGINIHAHCNGDATVGLFCDAVETLLTDWPWLDHRHTVQHCQLTTRSQYRRMARLGLCANIFANHIWYWGDQHHDQTVGPERVKRMWACATAIAERVPFSLHSDAPVTPLGQLHTMWCAVNRITPSGRVLGEHERITATQALEAVTVGGAFQMHLDHEIGSIEGGKLADFAVLGDDPLLVDPLALRDIPVWGTVVGGVVQPAGTASS
jgi:predicted amidohydrolase YtcJ